MDLHEEYFTRKKINIPIVKFVERAHLVLRARDDKKPEWNILHLNLAWQTEPHHPGYYHWTVSANPVIYASSDYQHITYSYAKQLEDSRLEWDNYEHFLVEWAARHSQQYQAMTSQDAVFVSWGMFCQNYDSWLANTLPWRLVDVLALTLFGEKPKRLEAIRQVEDWVHERYERVWSCWKSIRNNYDQRNYADWYAKIVNDMEREPRIVAYSAEELKAAIQAVAI